MPKLPVIKGAELMSLLSKVGFEVVRQRGSHVRMRREKDGKVVTIPTHPGQDLDRGLLQKIITDDLEWSREYFLKLYSKYK